MIILQDVVKIYRPKKQPEVRALDGISLKIQDRGMVFILGKSGSGKSTLLNVLGGLDDFDSGDILVNGKSIKNFGSKDFDTYRNSCVGFIFQEYNLIDEYNIEQNLALALELQGAKDVKNLVNDALTTVGLKGYGLRKPSELSGGQRQRIAIARAIIKKPQIILADEPTGNLDSETGKDILELLKKLSEQQLVIVVSHDKDNAEKFGNRIINIADGKIVNDSNDKDIEANADLKAPEF